MWFGLFIVLVLILVVWWLLTQNAKDSQKETQSQVWSEASSHTTGQDHLPVSDLSSEDDLTLIEESVRKLVEF
jgi:hypothetical protein